MKLIDELYTPKELSDELYNNACFTADQASYIASDVYQPLLNIVKELDERINILQNKGK